MRAVILGDLGNRRSRNVLVARIGHLELRRQVGPKLEAVHAPFRIAFRHLLVQNAAAGCHPLHVARGHAALVAEAVAVRHFAGQDIGDGLDAAMRVPGKSGEIVGRILIAEIVEQQERVELVRFAEAEGALQFYACAFDGGLGLHRSLSLL